MLNPGPLFLCCQVPVYCLMCRSIVIYFIEQKIKIIFSKYKKKILEPLSLYMCDLWVTLHGSFLAGDPRHRHCHHRYIDILRPHAYVVHKTFQFRSRAFTHCFGPCRRGRPLSRDDLYVFSSTSPPPVDARRISTAKLVAHNDVSRVRVFLALLLCRHYYYNIVGRAYFVLPVGR